MVRSRVAKHPPSGNEARAYIKQHTTPHKVACHYLGKQHIATIGACTDLSRRPIALRFMGRQTHFTAMPRLCSGPPQPQIPEANQLVLSLIVQMQKE